MLYALLKFIYKTGLWVFYRQFEVRNRSLLDIQGPLLVVSNHPNTFMDPIVTASLLRQSVFFITKSTVFGSGFQSWMLRQMHLIPIHRREDHPNREINNDEAFAAINAALLQGKTLLIFPEGNSLNQRRLRRIKTGTARVALTAESAQALGIRILPVGLNYSAPTRFHSKVFVNVGEPISVADYMDAYQQDAYGTVQALTEEIRVRLEQLIIHTPSDEADLLCRQIELIYKDNLAAFAPSEVPLHVRDFLLTKAIVSSVNHFRQTDPARVAAFQQRLESYLQRLEQLDLRDELLLLGEREILRQSIVRLLYLIAGFPIYAYGLLHNYLPYIIPSKVVQRITKEEEWRAPIMLTVGIFTFPIFYLLEIWLVRRLLQLSWEWTLLYSLSLPLSGFLTLHFWKALRHARKHWRHLLLFVNQKHLARHLRRKRQEIIIELEAAREEYLQQATSNA